MIAAMEGRVNVTMRISDVVNSRSDMFVISLSSCFYAYRIVRVVAVCMWSVNASRRVVTCPKFHRRCSVERT
jgi:hypothetical protein